LLETRQDLAVTVEPPARVHIPGLRALAGAMPVRELAAGSRAAGLVSRRATLHARRRSASGAKAAPAEHQIGQACLRPPLRERRRLLAQPFRRVILREPAREYRADPVELAIPDPA